MTTSSTTAAAKLTTTTTATAAKFTTAAALSEARMAAIGLGALKAATVDVVESAAFLRTLRPCLRAVTAAGTISRARTITATGAISRARTIAAPGAISRARTIAAPGAISCAWTVTATGPVGSRPQDLLTIATTEIHALIPVADISFAVTLAHIIVVVTHAVAVIRVVNPIVAFVDIDIVVDVDVVVAPADAAAPIIAATRPGADRIARAESKAGGNRSARNVAGRREVIRRI
jgi:hypothetical protein